MNSGARCVTIWDIVSTKGDARVKSKLYANMKRLTTIFCVSILVLTVGILVLRLTVFKEMAAAPKLDVEVLVQTRKHASESYTMNYQPYFPTVSTPGNLLLESPPGNSKDFTLTIMYERDTLIKTTFLHPGDVVETHPMEENIRPKLAKGVYACTATIKVYEPDTRELLDSWEEQVNVYIEEMPPSGVDTAS